MIGRPGPPGPSPIREGIGLAVLLLVLSGCAGATLVASASPLVVTPPPTHTPPAALGVPPSPSPTAAPTPGSSAAALPSLRPPAGATVTMLDTTYAIVGDTAVELVAAMRAQNLVDPAGDAGFALTTWDLVWTYEWVTDSTGRCGIRDLAVTVDIETTLPSWKPPTTAEAGLVSNWKRFTDALVIHERGHAQNGLDRAAEIAAAMAGIDPRPTCDTLENSADAVGAAIIDVGRKWDITYDAETNHGATQGAIFP